MARLGMGGGWGGGRLTRSPPHFGFKSKWDVDIDGGGVLGGGMTVVFAKSKNVALIVKDWEID